MRICVIDGQGGGIGSSIIKKIKEEFKEKVEIVALGTNSIATFAMMKTKANKGATGENAIIRIVKEADIIVGTIGIVLADSMLGELTPRMAEAIASSPARKILFPISQEKVEVVGVVAEPLSHLVDILVNKKLKELIK
jgi:hypothetical protein